MHEAVEQGTPLHLREIGRRAGVSATAVQYELRLLRQLGMVQDIGTEKRPLYVLNRQHELFPDLHNMILRRSGESLLSADDAPLARKRVQQRRDRSAKSEQNSAFLKQWGTLADKVQVR
jgi:predicted transcriptional regulator